MTKKINKNNLPILLIDPYNNIYDLGGTISAVGGAATSILGSTLSNAQINQSKVDLTEALIKATRNTNFNATSNNNLLSLYDSINPMANVSWADIRSGNTGSKLSSMLGAIGSGASAGASVGGGWGAAAGGAIGLIGSGIGWIVGDTKAQKERDRLNKDILAANNKVIANFSNAVENVDANMNRAMLANYSAYGGPLNFINNYFANGGLLDRDLGFNNGVTQFDNGGTHELNPLGGIPLGTDLLGTPNMVELGEVKFGDYIFSNRLPVTKELVLTLHLSKSDIGKSFADVAKKLSKESKERPNDPISKMGLDSQLKLLQLALEYTKQQQLLNYFMNNMNRFDDGGWAMGLDSSKVYNNVDTLRLLNYLLSQGYKLPKYKNDGKWGNETANALMLYQTDQRKNNGWNTVLLRSSKVAVDPMNGTSFNIFDANPQVSNQLSARQLPIVLGVTSPTGAAGAQYILQQNLLGNQIAGQLSYIPTSYTNDKNKSKDKGNSNPSNLSYLRYAPAVGSAFGVFSDLIGATNKPDYTAANMIGNVGNNLPSIHYNPIANYMQYKPFDVDYYENKLGSLMGAIRNQIVNNSNGNRAQAMANMLAANNQYIELIGDLGVKANLYNDAQKQLVENFNRATNMFNSELDLKAQLMGLTNNELRLRAIMAQALMMQDQDNLTSQAKLANLTNLFDNLGAIGTEEEQNNWLNGLIESGVYGQLNVAMLKARYKTKEGRENMARSLGWSEELIKQADFANGGTIKFKRKGLTY